MSMFKKYLTFLVIVYLSVGVSIWLAALQPSSIATLGGTMTVIHCRHGGAFLTVAARSLAVTYYRDGDYYARLKRLHNVPAAGHRPA